MKLYSRSLDHNQNALQKFHEAAQERGFQEPDFHLLTHDRRHRLLQLTRWDAVPVAASLWVGRCLLWVSSDSDCCSL
ncbi:epididymal-specific lipocalin-5-like [Fukomys damarensis]|uniref:epididymal-specific lipocalin-5-like n=1 Tax=Fukomys damarensis TaxID=885580 RepID=UPI001455BF48|nr:epididymal-specific lipocalin-5-like [Fukomys damarensis]